MKLLEFLGKEYKDLNYIEVNDSHRLYYFKKGDISFSFTSVYTVSYAVDVDNKWVDKDTEFEYMVTGSGTFDGIRHLHFIDTDEELNGYIYYPNFEEIKTLMDKLVELEKKLINNYESY